MKYFISRGLYTFNSGLEHAQAERTQLFNEQGDAAYYVSQFYNRMAFKDAIGIGLNPKYLLNMYDYFQEALDFEPVRLAIDDFKQIPFDEYQLVSHGPNYSTVEWAGRILARIDILPETVGLVGSVQYFDRTSALVSQDLYDWRGFKSSTEYFHPNGEVSMRRFYNVQGEVVLENIFMNIDGEVRPTMWKLKNYHGRNYQFVTEEELFLFFLNEVLSKTTNNILVSDHRDLDAVVCQAQPVDQKWAAFHGAALDPTDEPFAMYGAALWPDNFDGVIVSNQAQKDVLQRQFKNLTIKVASDVAVELQPEVAVDRQANLVIFSGRFERDKQPLEALKAFEKVAKKVPNAVLEFRGYTTDQEYLSELKDFVNKHNLDDQVIFGDYLMQSELDDFYNRAQVLVNTSFIEAGGRQLIEAFSHGVPVVSYAIKYGISDLIQNGQNGYVVTNENPAALAKRVIEVLNDAKLHEKLSRGAYQTAKTYQASVVYEQWHNILN